MRVKKIYLKKFLSSTAKIRIFTETHETSFSGLILRKTKWGMNQKKILTKVWNIK